MLPAQSLIGVVAIPLLAWLCSENRALIAPRTALATVGGALALQYVIAAGLLLTPWAGTFFRVVQRLVGALQQATRAGMQLVFGYLGGGPAPFAIAKPENAFVLALHALPMILVLSALARLLYHWGALQLLVRAFARLLQGTFGIGGPLGTVAAAKVFLGMVEAPLLVRPYLASLGRGALFAAMTCGMATVAGTVMALYGILLEPHVPGAAGHVLAASLMNVPAALMLGRLAVPEGFAGGPSEAEIRTGNEPRSSIDAVVQGTIDGIRLLASVCAMLVVMTALVDLANSLLGLVATPLGRPVSVQMLLGLLCAPVAWLIGIPWPEAVVAGGLIGEKIVLNEFIAYLDLAAQPSEVLSARTRLIMTYALCGFANLGSLGIMIGGLTAMVPERRDDILALAPRAMIFGALATLLSGAVIGTLSW